MEDESTEPQRKRQKFSPGAAREDAPVPPISAASYRYLRDEPSTAAHESRASTLLDVPISPPTRKETCVAESTSTGFPLAASGVEQTHSGTRTAVIPSPIQLTRVEGLATVDNIDTVTLRDLVGDPLVKECWAFNYLFDVEFLLSNLDEDVRELVEVYIIHGSWKREDTNRVRIEEAAASHQNVKVITAYMPEAFGTHHSKMMILIRHDDTAEIIICTANILPRDWNMCQAVWRSPRLPLNESGASNLTESDLLPVIGTGARFKCDLLLYLKTYGSKLKELTKKLNEYDFSRVRACLVASAPARQDLRSVNPNKEKLWGWPGLKHALQHVPCSSSANPRIVIQISSVATLGAKDDWLRQTLFKALGAHAEGQSPPPARAEFSIVFPTADEIRRSIDGYGCGGSIHWKTQSAPQAKQLQYIRPMLCHWAGDPPVPSRPAVREAGRRRVGPHIKTYLRFSDGGMNTLDWALVTSANLSKQAWGAEATSEGQVRICSYEIGVLVWPDLWREEGRGPVQMVPAFKSDMPAVSGGVDSALGDRGGGGGSGTVNSNWQGNGAENMAAVLGLRMPYDLPLVPYSDAEMPWCATQPHSEPDWMGRTWEGY